MTAKVYDYIVIGASIPGIVFAIKKSLSGNSVLLTNMYGFPGGSIAEQLNCFQDVDGTQLAGIAKEIGRGIAPDNFERSIVNPESIKFFLQQMLEQSSVEPYYHTVPNRISINASGLMEVSLLAKEGVVSVAGEKVIDATEEFTGAVLFNRKRKLKDRFINLFITSPENERFLSFESIHKAVQLADGRYWISFKIDSEEDLFVENESHKLLDTFRMIADASKCRIQVLPLGVQSMYELDSGRDLTAPFAAVDDIIGSGMKSSEQLLKGSVIESVHTIF